MNRKISSPFVLTGLILLVVLLVSQLIGFFFDVSDLFDGINLYKK